MVMTSFYPYVMFDVFCSIKTDRLGHTDNGTQPFFFWEGGRAGGGIELSFGVTVGAGAGAVSTASFGVTVILYPRTKLVVGQ